VRSGEWTGDTEPLTRGELFRWGRTWLPRLGAGPQEQHPARHPSTTVDAAVVCTGCTELLLDEAFTYTGEEREQRDAR